MIRPTITAVMGITLLTGIWGYENQAHAASCWSAKQLRATASENRVRRGTAAANVAFPKTKYKTPHLPARLRGAIRRVQLPKGKKLVALTFDIGETAREVAGYDGQIFDVLRQHKVKASLFFGGHWIATHPRTHSATDGRSVI